jgi:hypothetical protein
MPIFPGLTRGWSVGRADAAAAGFVSNITFLTLLFEPAHKTELVKVKPYIAAGAPRSGENGTYWASAANMPQR